MSLLSPGEVREMRRAMGAFGNRQPLWSEMRNLCRDYLTLWERDKTLRGAVAPVLECVVEGREPGSERWQRLIDAFTREVQ